MVLSLAKNKNKIIQTKSEVVSSKPQIQSSVRLRNAVKENQRKILKQEQLISQKKVLQKDKI